MNQTWSSLIICLITLLAFDEKKSQVLRQERPTLLKYTAKLSVVSVLSFNQRTEIWHILIHYHFRLKNIFAKLVVTMYIKIRNAGSGETVMINNLSKLDNIGKVKQLVTEKWVTDVYLVNCVVIMYTLFRMKIESGKQRLLFQGKQLEDTYSLYDYDVKVSVRTLRNVLWW